MTNHPLTRTAMILILVMASDALAAPGQRPPKVRQLEPQAPEAQTAVEDPCAAQLTDIDLLLAQLKQEVATGSRVGTPVAKADSAPVRAARDEYRVSDAPAAIRSMIVNDVLFSYEATYFDIVAWSENNRSSWGSFEPSRQKQSDIDNVLLESDGRVKEDVRLWVALAEYSWENRKTQALLKDETRRQAESIERIPAGRTEFIRLYAALLREYISAIKGNGPSISTRYSEAMDKPKVSRLRTALQQGAVLGTITAAGLAGLHFLGVDVSALAVAGAATAAAVVPTIIASGRLMADGMRNPAKAYSIFKGEELLEVFGGSFTRKLEEGYTSDIYWASYESVSRRLRGDRPRLDVANYAPQFTSAAEADAEMESIVDEFVRFGEEGLASQRAQLDEALSETITALEHLIAESAQMGSANQAEALEARRRFLAGVGAVNNMIEIIVKIEKQQASIRADRIEQLNSALVAFTRHSKRQRQTMESDLMEPTNAALMNRIADSVVNWANYCTVITSDNRTALANLNNIVTANESLKVMRTVAMSKEVALAHVSETAAIVLEQLKDRRTTLMAGKTRR